MTFGQGGGESNFCRPALHATWWRCITQPADPLRPIHQHTTEMGIGNDCAGAALPRLCSTCSEKRWFSQAGQDPPLAPAGRAGHAKAHPILHTHAARRVAKGFRCVAIETCMCLGPEWHVRLTGHSTRCCSLLAAVPGYRLKRSGWLLRAVCYGSRARPDHARARPTVCTALPAASHYQATSCLTRPPRFGRFTAACLPNVSFRQDA